VVVRVLDIDVDKPLPFLRPAGRGKYANRGLQVLLENPAVLQTQLLALAKASKYYPDTELWVMAPMVLNAKEAQIFVRLARAVGLTKVGVMVEVPELAKPKVMAQILTVVDFLSIGTNDLTQYVLGRSRHRSSARLLDARHPKVMRTIEAVVTQAKKADIPVGVCGEAAADVESAKQFISLGVSSLSASPALIPQLAAELMNQYL
jgi:phosphotransferase system enzyme I (PtsI)